MYNPFHSNLVLFQSTPTLPSRLSRLLQAVAMKRFDPMIGYGYALTLVSALAQRVCRIKIGDDFGIEAGLYFLIIAPSGSGKGAMWKPLYAPIRELVEVQRNRDNAENKRRQTQITALDGVIAEKKKLARKYSGNAAKLLVKEIAELEEQKPQLIPELLFDVQDVTSASLLKELDGQASHSILIADTEGRFMRSLDEDKALSPMLNQTFIGEGINNSRASTKSIRVDNPRVSIIAAIQPEKLIRLTRNPNLWGEGFMARVLPYYAFPQLPCAPAIGDIVDSEIMAWWREKVDYLFHMPLPSEVQGKAQAHILELDADAKVCFENHVQQLQNSKMQISNMGLQGTIARMPELTARLSAVYHILEHPSPFDAPISGQIMQFAIGASSYFLDYQIRRLYQEFNPDPAAKLLPRLCGWLKSRIGTNPYVTPKDMYNGIGGEKSGLMRAIQQLSQQGVLVPTCDYELDFSHWIKVRSYGFNINFALLNNFPD